MNLMVLPNQLYLIVKLYLIRPVFLPDTHDTDKGIARGNIIESFSLIKGTNTIKILFADNMAHTVIKKMYYEEK